MTNCKCGNSLREGESECDECLLKRYDIQSFDLYDDFLVGQPDDKITVVCGAGVAKALRRAEKGVGNAGG